MCHRKGKLSRHDFECSSFPSRPFFGRDLTQDGGILPLAEAPEVTRCHAEDLGY